MKNDKEKMNLEQLLDTLEHAGRDIRRQQEIDAMIDRLAAAEKTPKHSFLWWTSRVAAAACVTFFVITAIRVWFIPTSPANDSPIVAEKTEQGKTSVLSEDTTITPAIIVPTLKHPMQRTTTFVKVESETVTTEELLAEMTVIPDQTDSETETDSTDMLFYIIEDDLAPDTKMIATNEEPEKTTKSEPVATSSAKPQRQSIFRNFFHRAEPSRMEGTTLALLQF